MPKRTSINDIQMLDDLNDLERIVQDKRLDKRSNSKKERRNRHYSKVLIKHELRTINGMPYEKLILKFKVDEVVEAK
jgi:hypothetical protein